MLAEQIDELGAGGLTTGVNDSGGALLWWLVLIIVGIAVVIYRAIEYARR